MAKLQRNRLTTTLFDTKLFAQHIEAAFEEMVSRYQSGQAPQSFEVQPI